LPGSRRERELLGSWARMMGQLLAHSDKPETALLVPAHLRDVHRPRDVERDDAPVERAPGAGGGGGAAAGARSKKRGRAAATSLWDEDGGGAGGPPLLPPLMATGGGAGGAGAGGGTGLPAFDLGEAEAAEALLAAAGF